MLHAKDKHPYDNTVFLVFLAGTKKPVELERPLKIFYFVVFIHATYVMYRWGRWNEILNHGRFKWHLTERDMEILCRALLVYCVRHYKGDDKIKSFIWDLITPTKDGHNQALQNHSGNCHYFYIWELACSI